MKPPPGEVRQQAVALPGYARPARPDAPQHAREGPEAATTARARVEGRIALLNPSWIVLFASLGLVAMGLLGISMASGLTGEELSRLVVRQGVFVLMGVVATAVVAVVDYRRLGKHTPAFAAVTLGLLVFVLIPFVPESIVRPVNGARRWINLGFIDFQPSELAKVVFVLALGWWLRRRSSVRTSSHRRLMGLIAPGLMAVVPMGLILVEPDLGTASLIMPALVAMLIAGGARLVHLISTGVIGLTFAAGVVIASVGFAQLDQYPLLRPHQVERIQAMVDVYRGDERFVDSRGFQGRQARMLIGAGGVDGHPEDRARAFVFFSSLPERHNDMIYAVLVNRFGLVGALSLIGLYAAWIAGALWTAASCKDPFGRVIVVGFVAIVGTQAFINIGMTQGLLPITGMTLPFVSYGGSSLLMAFVMVGLVMSVGLRRPGRLWRKSYEF